MNDSVKKKDFSSCVFNAAAGKGYPLGRQQESGPLSGLSYPQEREIKNLGIRLFWKLNALEGIPEPLIDSPLPRTYRSTSKRRIFKKGERFFLLLDPKAFPSEGVEISPLEPEGHENLFIFLAKKLNTPPYKTLAEALNYIIIRESGDKKAVIFNIHRLSAEEVRKIKLLSGHLEKSSLSVLSVFYYYDPTRSSYYLESVRPESSLNFRRLCGPGKLMLELGDKRFFYGPTVFSQVNPSVLPQMLEKMEEFFTRLTGNPEGPGRERPGRPAEKPGVPDLQLPPRGMYRSLTLLDLYCGYGLFGIILSGRFSRVYGMEINPEAVKNAQDNSRHLSPGTGSAPEFHFKRDNILVPALEKFLPPPGRGEITVLDPPRGGTAEGVIPYLASRRPLGVVHLFCNPDLISGELKLWKNGGYIPKEIIPVDMFPGTAGCEIMIFLTKD